MAQDANNRELLSKSNLYPSCSSNFIPEKSPWYFPGHYKNNKTVNGMTPHLKFFCVMPRGDKLRDRECLYHFLQNLPIRRIFALAKSETNIMY